MKLVGDYILVHQVVTVLELSTITTAICFRPDVPFEFYFVSRGRRLFLFCHVFLLKLLILRRCLSFACRNKMYKRLNT
jgi:hypothetical protein